MTVKEVCKTLGISRATLYRRIETGAIQPVKPNPSLYKQPLLFRREDVEKLKQARAERA